MYQVTGEIIKSAISLKIRNSLAAGTPVTYPTIYKENIAQQFNKPCFFIKTIDVDQVQVNKYAYERLYQMNIRYHIDEQSANLVQTLEQMGNDLLEILRTIDVEIIDETGADAVKPVRGLGMTYKITEDVLQFFVNYRIKVTPKLAAEALMTDLEINQV